MKMGGKHFGVESPVWYVLEDELVESQSLLN